MVAGRGEKKGGFSIQMLLHAPPWRCGAAVQHLERVAEDEW